MKEPRVNLSIIVYGGERVVFVTKFGWASKMIMELDMCNIDDAKKAAMDFLKDLELLPADNDPGNGHYVNQAVESIIPKMLENIPKLRSTIFHKKLLVNTNALKACIKLTETHGVVTD